MGYIEDLRKIVGNHPLILVRPSAAIINGYGQILLVKYQDQSWGIPGGLMELGESVEECLRREVKEELSIELKTLKLLDVFSGSELHTKLRNGHEYYNIIIGYICTEYYGEIIPDGNEVLEARYFNIFEVPESTQPFIKHKLNQLGPKLKEVLRASQ
ncbi:NUDIX hydrolase [Paenibacillus dakarensis]|uniref:NUDIX hydrolase n=1 Tax=Paenibacillus dakarensis TaxID=1527293 RepID=UPI0006D533E8|nr:NUDIX domain-containing protein [Paenibacillus dakarensis]